MSRKTLETFIAVAIGTLLCVSVWWCILQWNECRALGFSVLYCLKHCM